MQPASQSTTEPASSSEGSNRRFAVSLARAFGGAVVFSLPILLTQEMWALGFSSPPERLIVLLVLAVPLLVGLSHLAGFEPTFEFRDDAVDALVALAVGFVASGAILGLLGVLDPTRAPARELIGGVAVQAVPAAIGALLAGSILGSDGPGREQQEAQRDRAGYGGEVFLMAVGALFLAFPVVPTEEIVLSAHRLGPGLAVALALVSLALVHAFVYSLDFRGGSPVPEGIAPLSLLLRLSVVGYAVALLVSAYLLWTFGQLDGLGTVEAVKAVIVAGLPASVGAAAARLIL